jgi:serine/threonine protein kinase
VEAHIGTVPGLAPGAVLGKGDLAVTLKSPLGKGPYGDVWLVHDRAGRSLMLWLLRPDLLMPKRVERLQSEMATVSRLAHKNLVRTLGATSDAGHVYVLAEAVPGARTLGKIIAERTAPGRPPFSLKGAYNVVAHLCNALGVVHGERAVHAAITPDNILVNKAGRIKLVELGLARAFPQAAITRAGVYAPEFRSSPDLLDRRADVFSLGAILFQCLTGKPYSSGARASMLVPGLPAEVDAVISRAMAPAPAERFADTAQLKAGLAAVLEGRAGASGKMPAAASAPAAASPAASGSRPKLRVTEDEERWLVSKGKVDFGPYSFAHIKEGIQKDEILPGHILIDNETGQRSDVIDHPGLHDLVMEAAQKREDARRVNVEQHVEKHDKRRGFALYGFIGGGVAILGVVTFLVIKAVKKDSTKVVGKETALLGGADLKGLKMTTVKRVNEKPGQRPSRPSGKPSDPGFDDSKTLDLNGEGGEEQLDENQINDVIHRHGDSLGGCLLAEANRGGSSKADIEFIVQGNGKVSGVRVNGETGSALAGCIRGRMQSFQFPPFNGSRTKASFDMSL